MSMVEDKGKKLDLDCRPPIFKGQNQSIFHEAALFLHKAAR